jgi:hypothetical protein
MTIFSFRVHFTDEKSCRLYFKAKLLEDPKIKSTDRAFLQAIEKDESIVFKDQSTSYVNIADYIDIYISEKSNE